MAHTQVQLKSKTQNLDKKELSTVRGNELAGTDSSFFYELEAAR
jgi:hypothetical protein